MLVVWIIFAVLALLTLVWFVLVRSDANAYVESQVKVLGPENRHYLKPLRRKVLFLTYGFVLLFILLGFGFYLLSLS